jgi:hypothetical protein
VRPRLVLQVGPDRLRLEHWSARGDAPAWEAECPRSLESPLASVVASLLEGVPNAAGSPLLTILVERPLAQVRRLGTLPPVRRDHLAALVQQQASTFFRKNGHPLVTDATWLAASNGGPREALLAAVDLELADALRAGAAEAGVEVARLTVAAEPAAMALDLAPLGARATRRQAQRRSLTRLAAGVAMLWCLAGSLWAARLGLELHRTRIELARLGPARQALLAGQKVRHRAEEMLLTLDAAEAARPRLEERLLAIAAALPDSAYLSGLSMDTLATGLLTGAARRATEVVAALDHAHAGPAPRLEGAVTPDLGGHHWERFTIRLGVPAR